MKISELFPDVVTEDTEYEFKALLKQEAGRDEPI